MMQWTIVRELIEPNDVMSVVAHCVCNDGCSLRFQREEYS